jgi:hypothetical protein
MPSDVRDAPQQQHRRVAVACFELREIPLGDSGGLRHGLASKTAPLARLPHLATQR